MVKAGVGITALATWAVRKELDEKKLVAVPLGKRKLKRNWCLLRSPDRKPNLAEEKFAKFTLEATKVLSSLVTVATMFLNAMWQAGLFDFGILSVQV